MNPLPAAEPARILLVEDEQHIRDIFTDYLRLSGFVVVTAQDGVEALERIKENPPDLMVLDIRMPRMDGWEVCERLRKDPAMRGLPIIVLTACVLPQDREHARSLDIQGFVAKPCDPADLVQEIKKCLSSNLTDRK